MPAAPAVTHAAHATAAPRANVDFAEMNLFSETEALTRSFGADAQRVPITTESKATRGAEGMTAFGRVHLAPGRSETESHEGRVRLGHEVAHAIQQERGAGVSPRLTRSHRAQLESEAERAGHAFASGASFSIQGRAPQAAPLYRGPGELSAFDIEQNEAWAKLEAKWAIIDERIAAQRKEDRAKARKKATWVGIDIPVDDALRKMPASMQQHELDIRFVQQILGKSGGAVSREDAAEVLRRIGWRSRSVEDLTTAEQIRSRDKIHYRSKAAAIVVDEYNNFTEDRRRAWARGWEKGNTGPNYADAVFADIGRGMWNGGLTFAQGLIDLPYAVPNLFLTIAGEDTMHTADLSGGRLEYETDYGLHQGGAVELGTVLGLSWIFGKLPIGGAGGAAAASTAASQASKLTRFFGYLKKFMTANAVVGAVTSVIQAGQAINDLRNGYTIKNGVKVPLTEDEILERLASIAFGIHTGATAIKSRGAGSKSGSNGNEGKLATVPAAESVKPDLVITRPDPKTIRITPVGKSVALVLDEKGWHVYDEKGAHVRSGPPDEAALLGKELAGVDLPATAAPAPTPASGQVPTVPQLPAPREPAPVVQAEQPSAPKAIEAPKAADPPRALEVPRAPIPPRLPAPTEPEVAPEPPTTKETPPVVEPTTTPEPPAVTQPTPTPSAKKAKAAKPPKPAKPAKPPKKAKQPKSNAAAAKGQRRAKIQEQLDEARARKEQAGEERAVAAREVKKLADKIAALTEKLKRAKGDEKAELQKELDRARDELSGNEQHGGWAAEQRNAGAEQKEQHWRVRGLEALLKLGRPTLRKATKAKLKAAARAWMKKMGFNHPEGAWVDQVTHKVITDKPVFGHVKGHEHWRLALEAQKKGWSQEQFNDWVNENAEKLFQIESEASNRSHAHEDHSDFDFTDFDD